MHAPGTARRTARRTARTARAAAATLAALVLAITTTAGPQAAKAGLDTDPPILDIPTLSVPFATATQGTEVTVTGHATDGTAVARMEARVDDGPWQAMYPTDGAYGGTDETATTAMNSRARRVLSISAGYRHTCAVLADHTVWCSGLNDAGQLGDGTTGDQKVAIQVRGISTATAVASGSSFTCAVLVNGTVECWGANDHGQLGDGTIVGRGQPAAVQGIDNAIAITAGSAHACALLTNHQLACWGWNNAGQAGPGVNINQLVPMSSIPLTGVTAITAGTQHTCAVLEAGAVYCWGGGMFGEAGGSTVYEPVPGIDNATAIASTSSSLHTCAVRATGAVTCWGYNPYGEAGADPGTSVTGPVNVGNIANAVAVTAGGDFSCAVLSTGHVTCWGNNASGQAAIGNLDGPQLVPVDGSGLTTAVAITAGASHACAILQFGVTTCWGSNSNGQVMAGLLAGLDAIATPTPAQGLPGTRAVPGYNVCVRAFDPFGNRTFPSCTYVSITAGDGTAPVFTKQPTLSVPAGAVLPWTGATTGVPLVLSWAATDQGEGIATYAIRRSLDGGANWSLIGIVGAGVTSFPVSADGTPAVSRFRVTATDVAGNATDATGVTFTPSLVQQTSAAIKWAGTWKTYTSGTVSAGSTRYATTAGATASYTFTGRSVGLVTMRGPGRGYAWIYLDGGATPVAKINLYKATAQPMVIAWSKTWATSGKHTVKVWVAGTAGKPRVDVDAFLTLP